MNLSRYNSIRVFKNHIENNSLDGGQFIFVKSVGLIRDILGKFRY